MRYYLVLSSLFLISSCQADYREHTKEGQTLDSKEVILLSDSTIKSRFQVPENCQRTTVDSSSFEFYLRHLPLKEEGSSVLYYDGDKKPNRDVYLAVVDMSLGNRDLQQCADAVMRLRGEYLFEQKDYESIHFNFLSDGKPRYFSEHCDESFTYPNFLKYMDYIFAFANTSSLHDELEAVTEFSEMKIGDVFIQKGSPYGHAVIVVDMCEDEKSGQKYYMLAQSYMPAQDTQILCNPNNPKQPWYELKEGTIYTPEWTFESSDLRRFTTSE